MPSLIGRHMPLDAHPLRALQTAHEIGCEAIQIFVSSPRTWAPPATNPEDTAALAEALRGFGAVVIHAAYLINCASSNPDTRAKSQRLLRWTLERGAELGASDVVFHIGSHGGDGLTVGVERLIAALTEIGQSIGISQPRGVGQATGVIHHAPTEGSLPRLLLENDVGAGNTIGANFAAIAEVLGAVRPVWGEGIGVCIDTAHLWGAGEDIGTPDAAEVTLGKMDSTFGLGQIRVFHLNDTATVLGGHRDLHARLGEGSIGAAGLRVLLTDPRLAQPAIILETPIKELEGSDAHDWAHDRGQIASARELVRLG